MIVEFSVENFRSIKERQTISFVATGLKSPEEYRNVDKNNIAIDGGMSLLKTVGIYGANASGKSNIIKALTYFLLAIRNEASSESNLSDLCDSFFYQDNANHSEAYFQIVIIIDKNKYRYGFTVKKNPNYFEQIASDSSKKISKEIITNEWLYGTKETNQGKYFTRIGNKVNKETLANNEKFPEIPSEHFLFLTFASAFDPDGVCAIVRNFLSGWTISNLQDGEHPFLQHFQTLLEFDKKEKEFLDLLSTFNLKYDRVFIRKSANKTSDQSLSKDEVYFEKTFSQKKNKINQELNLKYNESDGTQKLFVLASLLFRAFNFKSSGLIILDEIDSNFHPSLLIKLIKLINDPSVNKSNAQLLFTSHDTNLMSPEIMRRDQFYFTEKNEDDSTRLYSLAELKGIRNDADFAKQYLAGFYGGVPILEVYSNPNLENNDGTMEQ